MSFRTLDGVAVRGRRVLLRADLNVPTHRGQIGDLTRIERLSPTIRELSQAGARVVVISHFDRPRGRRVESMSLRPVAEALGKVLGRPVAFAANCIGPETRAAVAGLRDGEVIVLENTRFHSEEENNDRIFARELAQNGEIFVNDAFSAAHRAHASTEGVAHILPSYAGRLMQTELNALKMALGSPIRPVMAIIGGSKVSTKIELLLNLVAHIDTVVIGGAMANTFLAAEGNDVAWSMQEPELHGVARGIMARANELGCKIALPMDLVVALEFRANAPHRVVPSTKVPPNMMALDIGPATIMDVVRRMLRMRTVIWNGPMGAFETPPFDRGTIAVAHAVAEATTRGRLRSIAGGGDTMAALRHAGVADRFSYVSLGGGAFLEFLEGKTLPGVAALDPVNGPR